MKMDRGYQFSTDTGLYGEEDIEREFEINPDLLNQKYTGFKKQYEEEEEESEDDDYQDNDDGQSTFEEDQVKETIHGDGGSDAVELNDNGDADNELDVDVNTPDQDYQQIILKSILRVIYKARRNWLKIIIYSMLFFTNLGLITYLSSDPQQDIITNVRSFGDISKSIQHLQWQINDLNSKNKNRLHDLRNYLDLKLDEFSVKFNHIDDDLKKLKLSNKEILRRIETVNFQDVDIKNDKLPVILDEYNNIRILPEFNEFLTNKIQSSINNELNDSKFQLNYEKFIENYVGEIINSKIGFMNKEEILSLISLQFQENKKKLINEIKTLTKMHQNDQIKDIPKKLINQDLKQDRVGKVNYGQSLSGARIINYLTSSTFKPKFRGESFFGSIFRNSRKQGDVNEDEELKSTKQASPFIVLTPTEGYWRSAETENTQLGIKFLEPIYMNEFWYIHKNVMNGAILTSAPQNMELYIQLEANGEEELMKEMGYTKEIQGHHKVSELKYDLNGDSRQKFIIPSFIARYLSKSVIIVSKDNYGNEFFTSFYKFQIHGLTKFDLYSIKKIMNNEEINDSIKNKFKGIKSFGEDVMI